MSEKKNKGIGPLLGGVITSLAGGLFAGKATRDSEKPKAAGILRDVGITAAAASGGSLALNANGVIDCAMYGLEPEVCNLAHGLVLLTGFVLYWIGISRKKKEPTKSQNNDS